MTTRDVMQFNAYACANEKQTDDLILPLENGKSVSIPRMSEDDYALLLETLKLWKKRIVEQPAAPTISQTTGRRR